ncbi:MAG: HNH endonuclease [Bacteroidetes bacterium]|nr:MAG: HNH endonuclease [Bacteroidota bacterium]
MAKKRLSRRIRDFVKERAHGYCEYCGHPEIYANQFYSIEHIIPLSKNGTNELDNLAYSCQPCNGHKYNKTRVLDPVSGQIVPLFNPRKHSWTAHFCWSEDYLNIEGISATGRATVKALELNRKNLVNLRRILFSFGEHPPQHL